MERKALLLTGRVRRWMAESLTGRVLHIFENTCSLVNEEGAVITIAAPEIGPGPFTILLDEGCDFPAVLDVMDTVGAGEAGLRVGALRIDLGAAGTWDPVPDWRSIGEDRIAGLVRTLSSALDSSDIQPAIRIPPPPDSADMQASVRYAAGLAGLGPGLTPSGDDVLVGLIYAYWVRLDPAAARTRSAWLAEAAAPRTASLSAAMLRAAAAGEAGAAWHALVAAGTGGDPGAVRSAARELISIGHTSGADALAGFIAGLASD